MKKSLSLRLRVTLICGVLLIACCLLLTLSHTHYAYQMADAIEAIPLQPAQTVGMEESYPMEEISPSSTSLPARQAFRVQSFVVMGVIVAAGCLMVYWLTGKALSPLRQLDQQIRGRRAEDLSQPLPVPSSGDEVAGLTISFNQMSANLSEAFERQKRFSQCAAHELRTPLAVLKTRMALFRKKGLCTTPETDQLLSVLEEQTERLSVLVGDLLSLTNMDGLDRGEEVDLSQTLSQAAAGLEDLAGERGITLHLETQPGRTRGNRVLLERVFCNLIQNAIQYNRPDGVVTVHGACDGDNFRVEITDEGIGIPQELREQIFEPFFRVDKSRSRQLGGAGLGLSLVRAIVDLHGGRVWAEDAPGQGSRFVVMLPLWKKNG